MSKVFFPTALLVVRVPVPLLALFCLGCWEADRRQGKHSPAEEGGSGGKRGLGSPAWARDGLRKSGGKEWSEREKTRIVRRRD